MTDSRKRQPAIDEAPHAFPEDATVLAAPRQRAMPEPPYLEPKEPQRIAIHGHSVIPDVPTHHRLQCIMRERPPSKGRDRVWRNLRSAAAGTTGVGRRKKTERGYGLSQLKHGTLP
jgi:hypothetical protein